MSDASSGNGRDLWGPDFRDTPVRSAPVDLLKEQASKLTLRTGGRIVGEISPPVIEGGTVWISLYACAPALQDYRHKLVSIAHPIIVADPDRPFPMTAIDTQSGDQVQVQDMESFEEWLAMILASEAVHEVIAGLLRYSPARTARFENR